MAHVEHPKPRIETQPIPVDVKIHLAYREPNGWISPHHCFGDMDAAARYMDAIHHLAGHDAAGRRVWVYSPCNCL